MKRQPSCGGSVAPWPWRRSSKLVLDLLERPSLRFRHAPKHKKEAHETDHTIDPKCAGGSEDPMENWKSEREKKRGNPEHRHGNRNRKPAHAIGKDFRDQNPSHRRKRERVARNRAEGKQQYREALGAVTVGQAEDGVRQSNSRAAKQH